MLGCCPVAAWSPVAGRRRQVGQGFPGEGAVRWSSVERAGVSVLERLVWTFGSARGSGSSGGSGDGAAGSSAAGSSATGIRGAGSGRGAGVCGTGSAIPGGSASRVGSAGSSTGSDTSAWSRKCAGSAAWSALPPANCEMPSPDSPSASSPTPSHSPSAPCTERRRIHPFADRDHGTSRSRVVGPRRPRGCASHSTSPPSTISGSQVAASSAYTRPGSPRCRLLCSSRSHMLAGVRCPSVFISPLMKLV